MSEHWADILDGRDRSWLAEVLGGELRYPDLVISPDGEPYLYRWHVAPRSKRGNFYVHLQVASDPERPLHDHPWDNTSVIISGGYDETINFAPDYSDVQTVRKLREGDVVHRKGCEAHRLILACAYTLTMFSTGPAYRDWGFWYHDGWRHHKDVTAKDGNVSIMTVKDT